MKEALVIIDIQNDYFQGHARELVGSDKAAKNAAIILDHFRKNLKTIVHIQHIANRPGATFFIPGTYGAEIHHSVKPLPSEKVIVKHTPNSFLGTDLLEYLQQQEITDLTILGMMTHMCVDSTTRAAKDFGFNIKLIHDSCATQSLKINDIEVSAENVHNAFIAGLSYYYATVLSTEKYLNHMNTY